MANKFDVIVVGGGPGGYVAAIRAAQLGMKVAVVEKADLGGVCLNWGCIPTKALLRAAEIFSVHKHAKDFGFEMAEPKINFSRLIARSRDVAGQLSKGIQHLLKKNKVEVLRGHGKVLRPVKGQHIIHVQGDDGDVKYTADKVILSSGARARNLPHVCADGKNIWTARDAMTPQSLPKSLLVVGSGAIGIEFASFYQDLGVDVTVVEVLDRILPAEDDEISALAEKAFTKKGMTIYTTARLEKVESQDKKPVAYVTHQGKEQRLEVDKVLLAVGIQGNIEDLGLENTCVQTEKGHIQTDDFCQTAEPGLYAVGDVTGGPWLAHKASHEGILAVEHIAGHATHPVKKTNIPGCTYSSPQVASIGLSEAKARDQGYTVKVGRFPFLGNGKALAMGESEGIVKTVFDEKTGELLGAHMLGAEVTELIQGYCVAKTMEATEQDLMQTIFPHPTLSEMMHESVLNAFDKAIHI